MHNFIDIDIILRRGIIASIEVEFEAIQGYRGDHLDPPEPDTYEITGLSVNKVECFINRSASTPRYYMASAWYKTGPQLVQGGWHDDFCKLAKIFLDEDHDYHDEWQELADQVYNTEPSPC